MNLYCPDCCTPVTCEPDISESLYRCPYCEKLWESYECYPTAQAARDAPPRLTFEYLLKRHNNTNYMLGISPAIYEGAPK